MSFSSVSPRGRFVTLPPVTEVDGVSDFLSQAPGADEKELLAGLQRGDEAAFAALVDRYAGPMLRVASTYVRDRAVAEEVVQETWIGVLRGIEGFEGRSSLKTWLFRILTNRAKTRSAQENRSVPFSALPGSAGELDEPAVDADRFFGAGHPERPGWWALPPSPWQDSSPEQRLFGREARVAIAEAISALPERQREVIALRDVEGWSSSEVCETLNLSAANQRLLLHRARSKVRSRLERLLTQGISA